MIDFNDPYVQFGFALAVGVFAGTIAALSVVWFFQWLFGLVKRNWK